MVKPIACIGVIALGAIIVGLFQVKYKVRELRIQLVEVQKQIVKEQKSIHVLRAEWGYLTQPERLQSLNDKYLQLDTIHSTQVALSLNDLPTANKVALAAQ